MGRKGVSRRAYMLAGEHRMGALPRGEELRPKHHLFVLRCGSADPTDVADSWAPARRGASAVKEISQMNSSLSATSSRVPAVQVLLSTHCEPAGLGSPARGCWSLDDGSGGASGGDVWDGEPRKAVMVAEDGGGLEEEPAGRSRAGVEPLAAGRFEPRMRHAVVSHVTKALRRFSPSAGSFAARRSILQIEQVAQRDGDT